MVIVERGGTTSLHLPVGVYRTGRAGSELFQQLLEVVDGEVLRELVVEATAWADEAGRCARRPSEPAAAQGWNCR